MSVTAAPAKTAADPRAIARILVVPLSDGSISHNVELRANGATVILAATSRMHALAICAELNECAWAEAL